MPEIFSDSFFPNINLQDETNWATDFAQDVIMPLLPEAVLQGIFR